MVCDGFRFSVARFFDEVSRLIKLMFFFLTCGALLWLALTEPLHAGETTLTWTNPTGQEQCTDAGPLTNLAGTRIYQLIAEVDDPTATTYTVTGLKGGDYTFVATSYTDEGATSRLSGEASKAVAALTVIDERAYVVAKIKNGFLLTVAGTVPLGTACNEASSVNGKYVVPVDSVNWSATVRDVMVVAECG